MVGLKIIQLNDLRFGTSFWAESIYGNKTQSFGPFQYTEIFGTANKGEIRIFLNWFIYKF